MKHRMTNFRMGIYSIKKTLAPDNVDCIFAMELSLWAMELSLERPRKKMTKLTVVISPPFPNLSRMKPMPHLMGKQTSVLESFTDIHRIAQ